MKFACSKNLPRLAKKVYLAIDGVRYESGEINMEIITIQSDGTRLTYTTRKSGPEDPTVPSLGEPISYLLRNKCRGVTNFSASQELERRILIVS